MESISEKLWSKAMVLASTGQAKDISQLQAKLSKDFPDSYHLIFDDQYSNKLTYVQELIHKVNRKP